MSDAQRRARDPITGESEVISGMSCQEWYAMKEKQHGKEAMELSWKRAANESADRKQFEKYRDVLGKNVPKTFAEFQDLKYNSGEWEAFKSYKRAIQTRELSALADFPLYQATSKEIDDKLVGLTTLNGITITEKSSHFIARTIGSVEQRRSGVSVDRSLEALSSKDAVILPQRISPNGNVSQRFIFEDVELSINPETGNLIQVNPYSRGRKS